MNKKKGESYDSENEFIYIEPQKFSFSSADVN